MPGIWAKYLDKSEPPKPFWAFYDVDVADGPIPRPIHETYTEPDLSKPPTGHITPKSGGERGVARNFTIGISKPEFINYTNRRKLTNNGEQTKNKKLNIPNMKSIANLKKSVTSLMSDQNLSTSEIPLPLQVPHPLLPSGNFPDLPGSNNSSESSSSSGSPRSEINLGDNNRRMSSTQQQVLDLISHLPARMQEELRAEYLGASEVDKPPVVRKIEKELLISKLPNFPAQQVWRTVFDTAGKTEAGSDIISQKLFEYLKHRDSDIPLEDVISPQDAAVAAGAAAAAAAVRAGGASVGASAAKAKAQAEADFKAAMALPGQFARTAVSGLLSLPSKAGSAAYGPVKKYGNWTQLQGPQPIRDTSELLSKTGYQVTPDGPIIIKFKQQDDGKIGIASLEFGNSNMTRIKTFGKEARDTVEAFGRMIGAYGLGAILGTATGGKVLSESLANAVVALSILGVYGGVATVVVSGVVGVVAGVVAPAYVLHSTGSYFAQCALGDEASRTKNANRIAMIRGLKNGPEGQVDMSKLWKSLSVAVNKLEDTSTKLSNFLRREIRVAMNKGQSGSIVTGRHSDPRYAGKNDNAVRANLYDKIDEIIGSSSYYTELKILAELLVELEEVLKHTSPKEAKRIREENEEIAKRKRNALATAKTPQQQQAVMAAAGAEMDAATQRQSARRGWGFGWVMSALARPAKAAQLEASGVPNLDEIPSANDQLKNDKPPATSSEVDAAATAAEAVAGEEEAAAPGGGGGGGGDGASSSGAPQSALGDLAAAAAAAGGGGIIEGGPAAGTGLRSRQRGGADYRSGYYNVSDELKENRDNAVRVLGFLKNIYMGPLKQSEDDDVKQYKLTNWWANTYSLFRNTIPLAWLMQKTINRINLPIAIREAVNEIVMKEGVETVRPLEVIYAQVTDKVWESAGAANTVRMAPGRLGKTLKAGAVGLFVGATRRAKKLAYGKVVAGRLTPLENGNFKNGSSELKNGVQTRLRIRGDPAPATGEMSPLLGASAIPSRYGSGRAGRAGWGASWASSGRGASGASGASMASSSRGASGASSGSGESVRRRTRKGRKAGRR